MPGELSLACSPLLDVSTASILPGEELSDRYPVEPDSTSPSSAADTAANPLRNVIFTNRGLHPPTDISADLILAESDHGPATALTDNLIDTDDGRDPATGTCVSVDSYNHLILTDNYCER